MKKTANTNKDTPSTDRPNYKLTYCDELLLIRLKPESIAFLRSKNIQPDLVEDIYCIFLQKLRSKGISHIFCKKEWFYITHYNFIPRDSEILVYLKKHLKCTIADYYKEVHADKRDVRLVTRLSDSEWSHIPREGSSELNRLTARNRWDYILRFMRTSKKFDAKDIAIVKAAIRGKMVKFRRDHLYDAMTGMERSMFAPTGKLSASVIRLKTISAIGKRATVTKGKIRKFLAYFGDGFEDLRA